MRAPQRDGVTREARPWAQPHSFVQLAWMHDSNASRSLSVLQLAGGVSDERQLEQVGSAMQASATLQHDAVRHVSQSGMPVLKESVQAGLEPVAVVVPEPLPVLVLVLVLVLVPDSQGEAQSSSMQETNALYAASLSQLAGGSDERQASQV